MNGVNIGDVLVCHRDQPNPYHGSVCGTARVRALTNFRDGNSIDELVFWYAPAEGGAKKITADEVNWKYSGLKPQGEV